MERWKISTTTPTSVEETALWSDTFQTTRIYDGGSFLLEIDEGTLELDLRKDLSLADLMGVVEYDLGSLVTVHCDSESADQVEIERALQAGGTGEMEKLGWSLDDVGIIFRGPFRAERVTGTPLVRMTLEEAARVGRADWDRLDATTEEDIRRQMIEDGEDPNAEIDPSQFRIVRPGS